MKERLISELSNEIRANEYYKKDKIEYIGRTQEEAKELLKKIEEGYFDEIINNTSVRLEKLSKWDLKLTKKPTLKDFKIYCFIEEINSEIEDLNNKNLSLEEIKKEKEKYSTFLNRLNSGIYDNILNQKDLWFYESINFDTFINWDLKLQNSNIDISLTNYIVFAIYHKIMEHIKDINTYKERYGRNYETSYTHREQTPTIKEEQEEYLLLVDEILKNNYDWREARTVLRNFNRLKIYEDYSFPHNVEEVAKIFIPTKNIVYDEFKDNKACSQNIEEIGIKAKELYDYITPTNLYEIFIKKNETEVETYIRKMIVSQIDTKLLTQESDGKEETIIDMLDNPSNYKEEIIKLLYNKKIICNIAKGTLYSLFAYNNTKNINIYNELINLQKELNCWNGTVYYNDVNSVLLPNGDRIYSTPYEDIKSQYNYYQEEYNFYLNNYNSDLEYIEECVEIMGNVVTTQIFREGNKRTAKCLFNALLLSKGIVPPIINFSKDNAKLWNDIACNKKNRYMKVKKEILESSIKLSEQLTKTEIKNRSF